MDFLKAGQKLKLVPAEIRELSEGLITQVSNDGFIVATSNLNSEQLALGADLEVICPSENCLIRFESKVLDTINPDKILLSTPVNIRYVQRREYTRINMAIPVKVVLQERPDDFMEVLMCNISGGGIQFESERNFDIKSHISVSFTLSGKHEINAKLEVLRAQNEDNSGKWVISGQFSKISNFDRTTIVQLCFKRKLELNCKDLN